jgi:Outer membrane efflux protein
MISVPLHIIGVAAVPLNVTVLAPWVGYTYLQAIADEARIETADAQVKTAQALFDQATDRVNAGTSPDIDALRSRVELQSRQQQLIQARNSFAIRKLTVARVIGLAYIDTFMVLAVGAGIMFFLAFALKKNSPGGGGEVAVG